MFSKKLILFFLAIVIIIKCDAQNCNIEVKGYVFDEASQTPLSYVNIFIQETQVGATTDDDGNFTFINVCEGHYHFIVSHIGCADEKFHFDLFRDTTISIGLSHTPTSLGTVVVAVEKDNYENQSHSTVNRNVIEDNSNQNLSGILENESGVSLLKNGNGISKPIVHGLFGNRLLMLNNGILQSGQQWGNDHSPEIDPFSLDKITVLKGVSVMEYGGGNLGSAILTEPKRIEREPHLHGQVNYIFETNGRGHTVNTRLQKFSDVLAWRINGSWKKYGDRKTADYFLNNTGVEEANFSVQLEKSIRDKLFLEFYASTFNTNLGILRGAHIGNLTDLEAALTREVPFFTEPDFSYDLEAPSQKVAHHLTKIKAKYFINDDHFLEVVAAGQINNRKEFDVRRSNRSDIPALSLEQSTFNADLKYTSTFAEKWKLKIGNQHIITDNTNNPETGILPLIPDYISYQTGLFSTLSLTHNKSAFSAGIRYDFEDRTVLTITRPIPREIVRFENTYHNVSGLFTAKTKIGKTQSIGWNVGYTMRNPAINELYSNGLHQGVSGIEEGDVNLQTEKALNNTLEYKWVPGSNFVLNILGYYQRFNDYIYLNPQEETRLTIRGAFPVFKYEQTDAAIYGIDISNQFTFNQSFFGVVKYSYLRGRDNTNDQPLVFMPPNSLFGSLTYRTPRAIKLTKNLKMEDFEIELTNRFVFEQKNILEVQDFVAPPTSYNIVGLKFSNNLILPLYKIRTFIKADNLLNVRYRDYLNRQRYFADDLGFSLTAGINIKF